jgi:tRNA(Arg) A34 adenosine deaminase TadA
MCLGAIYWARPRRVIYANTKKQAAAINFDDEYIYNEIEKTPQKREIPFIHMPNPEAERVFEAWEKMGIKKVY